VVFLYPILFLVINCLDQIYIIEGTGNVRVRGSRSSDELLSYLKNLEVVVL